MKKVAFFTIILLYALFVADASPGLAVPAGPGVRTHIRRDGTIVKYQAHGDEFLHYLTDSEGNLVVFGDDGDLYIGAWADRQSDTVIIPGSIEESKRGVVIQTTTAAAGFVRNPASDDKDTPMCALKDPIPQRLIERAEKARAARDALLRRKRTKDAPQMEIARPQSGLGQQQVERKIAMIYVKFEDDSNTARFDDIAPTPETLHDMFFNENKFGTVAHFYRVNTNGAVKMTPASERWGAPNDGVVFVKLRGRHENWGNAENENLRPELIAPALKAAGEFIDYPAFDVNHDGEITVDELCLAVIVQGYDDTGYRLRLTPAVYAHCWGLDPPLEVDGVLLSPYFVQGAFSAEEEDAVTNPQLATVGTTAHEIGHLAFNFLDLYSYVSRGVGEWSLMGSGMWGKRQGERIGETPFTLDAYHLQQFIPSAVPDDRGDYSLNGSHEYARLDNLSAPEQYFLLQPLGNIGYGQGFLKYRSGGGWTDEQNHGVIIFHIDDTNQKEHNTESKGHFHVTVEEAHGGVQNLTAELLTQDSKPGTPSDLFSPANNNRVAFTDATDPGSGLYVSADVPYSAPTMPSGVLVTNISSDITGAGTETGTINAVFTVKRKQQSSSGGCSMAPGFTIVTLTSLAAVLHRRRWR